MDSPLRLKSKAAEMLVEPACGGELLSFSDRQMKLNLIAPRWREGKIRRGAGLIDHLLVPGAQIQTFARGQAQELGDFIRSPYEQQWNRAAHPMQLTLRREGQIRSGKGTVPLELKKTLTLSDNPARIRGMYQLKNRSPKKLSFRFGIENTFDLKDVLVNRLGEVPRLKKFILTDPFRHLRAQFSFSKPVRLWHFPLETTTKRGIRTHRSYRGVNLTWLWDVALIPHGTWSVNWELSHESA